MKLEEITTRDQLPQLFKELGYQSGAEIGVYKGEFTEKLCKAGLKIIGVDPYIVYKNYRKHPQELEYNELYEMALQVIAPYKGCKLLKKTSMEALADVPDESLDFVYIDGNHSLPYIAQDIYEWYRKVRKGGIISGHDYMFNHHNPYWIRICHVKFVVDICIKIFDVKKLYITTKDRHQSWFWVK